MPRTVTSAVKMLKAIIFSAVLLASAFADRPRANPLGERIVGGTATTINQWPFIVGMLMDQWGNGGFSQACGGSILTSRHILSAAHCFQGTFSAANRWQIRAGSTFRSSGGTVVAVSRIINHPQYNQGTTNYDIAVVVLSNNLGLSNTIAQASIPSQGWSNPDNALSYALGWGTTSSGGSPSETLLQGAVYTVNQQTCANNYGNMGWSITNAMLCAGRLGVGGVDACQGDSGGPFVLNNVVIGVTSWGYGCALANFPGVYARVSYFTNWITSTVNSS